MVMDLPVAMERNLAEHSSHLHRATSGMTVVETDDLLIADSGLPDDTFNIVANARLNSGAADARIAETTQRLLLTGRPFAWWVGPASRPTDISDRLSAAGFTRSGSENVMRADLHGFSSSDASVVDILRVSTPGQLVDYARVLAALWDPPAETVREFYRLTTKAALADDCAARYFVGYLAGNPVAAGEVFFGGGVAGIYNIATQVEFRRRGLGGAMTTAALNVAMDEGYPTTVLQASPEGEPVYRRLGFQILGQVTEHAIMA